MLGEKRRDEPMFYYVKLDDMIPEDHLLRLIHKHVDFSFIRNKVKHLYSYTGRPRHARIDASGAVHRVMVRGITRSAIFYDDVDRNRFMDRAGMVFIEERTTCYAGPLYSP